MVQSKDSEETIQNCPPRSVQSTVTSVTSGSGFGSLASMQQRSKLKSPPQQPGFPWSDRYQFANHTNEPPKNSNPSNQAPNNIPSGKSLAICIDMLIGGTCPHPSFLEDCLDRLCLLFHLHPRVLPPGQISVHLTSKEMSCTMMSWGAYICRKKTEKVSWSSF